MVHAGFRPGMKCLKEVTELGRVKNGLGNIKKKKYIFS